MKKKRKRREDEIRYFEVEKVNTEFNVVPPIKQIMCMSTGEGGKNFIKL